MTFRTLAAQLSSRLRGSPVLDANSPGYEESLKRWNAAMEKKAPIVVYATSAEDVGTVLKFRKEHKLDLAVCGGGHFAGAASVTDSGISLNLSRLNYARVDAKKKEITVDGGTTAGAVARAAAEHQLAVVAGNVSLPGFAGVSLGGGYGALTGQSGVMADQVLSAEVVLADGTIVTASPTKCPDLFWGLRGAGPMFGVVTQLTVRLHQLHNNNAVFAGAIMFPTTRIQELLQVINRIAPDPIGRGSITLVLASSPPTMTPMLIVSVLYDGTEDEAMTFLGALYALGPQMQFTSMMPYEKALTLVDWTAAMGKRQHMGSGIHRYPLALETLKWVIERHAEACRRGDDGSSIDAEVLFEFHQLDKVGKGPEVESVFPRRGTAQNVMVVSNHTHPSEDVVAARFVHDVVQYLWGQAAVEAYGFEVLDGVSGEEDLGVYTGYNNNTMPVEQVFGSARTEALRELKAKYDPENVFNKWYALDRNDELGAPPQYRI
ncbi:FAD-linked oxido [Cyphellophora attinorum]|uniref:FAD-linked oxido n=1 Tax=Cyphellophora attinorum TaxID=1664694 RepID=A0A0N1HUP0_9EURO|nr:FAD-linked oxido [Phialophora attinorum]KPI43156.1 FAD-linked oxido [Phialophora attinorum]